MYASVETPLSRLFSRPSAKLFWRFWQSDRKHRVKESSLDLWEPVLAHVGAIPSQFHRAAAGLAYMYGRTSTWISNNMKLPYTNLKLMHIWLHTHETAIAWRRMGRHRSLSCPSMFPIWNCHRVTANNDKTSVSGWLPKMATQSRQRCLDWNYYWESYKLLINY